MYEIEEFYETDGSDIKDLLKSCICNYYIKNKDTFFAHEKKKDKMHHIMETTNKYEILLKEGDNNVQTVR